MKKPLLFLLSTTILPFTVNIITSCSNKPTSDDIPYNAQVYDLPCFYINTENSSPITSKDDYLSCNVTINNTETPYKLSNEGAKIKGRGHSTWKASKKPYKLKFNEKVDLFGNGAAKNWTLLANHYDPTLIKNYLAFSVASLFASQPYTSSCEFVDLYVNNDYRGVYTVCEQVEVKENRIDIETPYTDPSKMSYLIELDNRLMFEAEANNTFSMSNDYYEVKYPDLDYPEYTKDYTLEAKNYLQSCMDALDGNDWSNVEAKIDVESCADSYILQEVFKNPDVGYSSFYMYIDRSTNAEAKLSFGPIWDFDLTCGYNGYRNESYDYKLLVAGPINKWFKKILKFDEFKNLVKSELTAHKSNITEMINNEVQKILNIPNSFKQNFKKWSSIISCDKWEEWISKTKQWLLSSLNFIYDNI